MNNVQELHDCQPGSGAGLPFTVAGAAPLRHCDYTEFRDPAALYDAYTRMGGFHDFSCHAPEGQCWHRVGFLTLNDVLLMGTRHTSFTAKLDEGCGVDVLADLKGVFEVQSPDGFVQSRPGGVILASLGGAEVRGSGGSCVLRVQPERITAAAAAIAGLPSGLPRSVRRRFERVSPMALQPGQAQVAAIQSLIRTIDDCFSAGPLVAERLGLDDVIHRTVATVLQPELLLDEPADLLRHRERAGRHALDELIDYIRANLDQPLRMSDLEARSHYSRRALQYAFQERLGCSPKQWIREQRLSLAMEQLQAPGKPPTIKAVALACGYLDAGHFCKDFKRRYGITPNQARRN